MKTALLSFLGFMLVFGAWAFAAPYGGPPDETQHAIRAAGVVSGQVAPKPVVIPDWNGLGDDGMGAYQRVPRGLASHTKCWGYEGSNSAACAPPIGGGPVAELPTSAGRYHPAYYLAVGLPLRIWPGWGGLVLARLISAALSAALLAWAFTTLARWSRSGLMLAALLACSTPMLAHLAGAVNPNGLEIAAGISLFSALIPLLLHPEGGPKPALLWLAGVSAVTLATLRSLGPVWLGFGLLAVLIGISRSRLRLLWRSRLARRWVVGVGVSLALSAAWIVGMGTGKVVGTGNGGYSFTYAQSALIYFRQWGSYLEGMVGVAGWFDSFMPSPFYWIWICSAGSLVLFALVIDGWSTRLRMLVVFVGAFVVPGILQVSQAKVVGFIIGGRYMMPLVVLLPLLAAFVLERGTLTARNCHTLMKMFCLLLLPAHLVLLDYTMVRWQRGARTDPHAGYYNPFLGTWHPPTGSVIPVVVMVVGLALTGWMFWRTSARIAGRPTVNLAFLDRLARRSAKRQDDAANDAVPATTTVPAEPAKM